MIPFSYQFHQTSGAKLSFHSSSDLETWEELPFNNWPHGSGTHEGRQVRYVQISVPEGGGPAFLQTLFHFEEE